MSDHQGALNSSPPNSDNGHGQMVWVSFASEERTAIKCAVTQERPYAERISLAFAVRLFEVRTKLREDHFILDEIDHLEGLRPSSRTKEDEQFRYPPLRPFRHKHFSAPRHLLRNIGIQWGLTGQGNRALNLMLNDVARTCGNDPDLWPKMVTHKLFFDGLPKRTARGLTGDWIIFAKHAGKNYYLDLATHEEGRNPQRLYQKLRSGGFAEFPFLFDR
jgi:hypothetical protein